MNEPKSPPERARGDLARELPWLLIALVLFAIQQLAIRRLGVSGFQSDVRRGLFLFIALAFVGLALHYRRFLGAWVMAAGIGLNLLPIVAHGGLMPVSYETVHDSGAFPAITRADIGKQLGNGKDILLNARDVHFSLLADRFVVTVPLYGTNIYSLGDFVLFGGAACVVVQMAASAARPARHRPLPDEPRA